MATLVLIWDIEDENAATGREETRCKRLSVRMAGTGASEEPVHADGRPGLTRSCYKLPDGWQLKSGVPDEETMVEHCEWDPALDATIEYIANTKLPARWRAKALADAVKSETARRKKR